MNVENLRQLDLVLLSLGAGASERVTLVSHALSQIKSTSRRVRTPADIPGLGECAFN